MVEALHDPSHHSPAGTRHPRACSPWSRAARAFVFIVRSRLLLALNYRTEVVGSFIGQFVIMTVGLFLWTAAYGTRAEVAGVQKGQMLSFVVLSVLMGLLLNVRVHYTVMQRVQSGQIAADIMRPMPPLVLWLAEDLGDSLANLLLRGPALLAAALLIGVVPLPAGGASLLLSLAATALSFLIVWQLYAMLAMVSFWTIELGNLGVVMGVLVRFLSGSVVPIWFFPGPLQLALAALPFIYTFQGTIGIYLGKYDGWDAGKILAIQLFWIGLEFMVLRHIWRRARRKLVVQGG
jgi:ABC-2 type transport system permease protein